MDELAKRFAVLADKYGENVIDASLASVKAHVYSGLALDIYTIIIAVCLLFAGLKCIKIINSDKYYNEDLYIIGVIVSFVVGIPIFLISLGDIIDPWTWIALNHPEVYIAHKILGI